MTSEFDHIDPRNNFYRVLQVDESADAEIIRLAYRQLARRHHPDLDGSPHAVRRMAALNHAYAVLRDPERRSRYDAVLDQQRRKAGPDAWHVRNTRSPYGDAGVPEGPPSGALIDFGRYRGWTLGQIRRRDPDFLEWLAKMPVGRRYRSEIGELLRSSP